MQIADRIKELCNENDVSGVDLGRKLGLVKSPLTDWKNGKSKPTLDQIINICEIFAVSADFILFGEHPAFSEDVLAVAARYDALDADGRACVLAEIVHAEQRMRDSKKEKPTGA